MPDMTTMSPFTVIGVYPEYPEDKDRFADHVEAIDAAEAEAQVQAERPSALIAGVIAGHVYCVDEP